MTGPLMVVMLLLYAIMFGLPIAVYRDAKNIGVRSGLLPGLLGWGPAGWAVLSLFLGIFAIPIYTFVARPRLIEKIRQFDRVHPLPNGQVRGVPSANFPKMVIGAIVLLVVVLLANRVFVLPRMGSSDGTIGGKPGGTGNSVERVIDRSFECSNDVLYNFAFRLKPVGAASPYSWKVNGIEAAEQGHFKLTQLAQTTYTENKTDDYGRPNPRTYWCVEGKSDSEKVMEFMDFRLCEEGGGQWIFYGRADDGKFHFNGTICR